MGGGVLSKLLTSVADDAAAAATKPTVLENLLTYRGANKELKDAINYRIYENEPELFHNDYEGMLLGEGGSSGIPRLHVDDLKHYFGRTEDIPSRYKRTTGKRDIDELAAMAGYDDIDNYVESIQGELLSRSKKREQKQLLSERRNDQSFIKETQKLLDDEKAQYSFEQPFEPSAKDYAWYLKNAHPEMFEKGTRKTKSAAQPEDNAPKKVSVLSINRGGDEYVPVNVQTKKETAVPEAATKYLPRIERPTIKKSKTAQATEVAPQPAAQSSPTYGGVLAQLLGIQAATSYDPSK